MTYTDARVGLDYIMRKNFAENSWDKRVDMTNGIKGFVISKKVVGRSKHQRFFVPLENVEEAERVLKDGGLPLAWVYEDIERLKD